MRGVNDEHYVKQMRVLQYGLLKVYYSKGIVIVGMGEMEQLFVVVVNDSKEEIIKDGADVVLARALNLSEQSVQKLLDRVPGVVTKATSKTKAKAVAENFAKAGISCTIKAVSATKNDFTKQSNIGTAPVAVAVKPVAKATDVVTKEKIETKITRPEAKPDKAKEVKAEEAKTEPQTVNEDKPKAAADEKPVEPRRLVPADSASLYRSAWRSKLWRKIFSISSTTALALFLANLIIFWALVRPIVTEQITKARLEPSLVSSASLSDSIDLVDGELLVSPRLLTKLVKTIDTKSIDFLVISDINGKTVSNWHPNYAISSELNADILQQSKFAGQGNTGIYYKNSDKSFFEKLISFNQESIAYQPLIKNSQIAGSIIIGVSNISTNNLINRLFKLWFLLNLIPLAFVLLLSAIRSRNIANRVLKISRTADELSRGQLSNEVQALKGDELEHLANALERLRVSMSEALIRLRKKKSNSKTK